MSDFEKNMNMVSDENENAEANNGFSGEENAEVLKDFTDEMGVIASGTKIIGDIDTKGHLAISGVVKGKITAKGNVMLDGTVVGDIKCKNLLLQGGDLSDTEIISSGHVIIKEGVNVKGHIECQKITISGKVEGTVVPKGRAAISSTASFKGDLTADSLGMEFGAKLSGSVKVEQ